MPGSALDTRKDLVKRAFTADRPDRLCVAEIIRFADRLRLRVRAFVVDSCSRRL